MMNLRARTVKGNYAGDLKNVGYKKAHSEECAGIPGRKGPDLSLTGFEAAVGFVDYIQPATAADDATIAMAAAQRFKRVFDFHNQSPTLSRLLQPDIFTTGSR